ncbi:MAG: ribose 5-phosphate isomerase B [Rickettsiales bacterium]|nr:ribose 5-phosphate isomerase B [Rickettsiales bacterium]
MQNYDIAIATDHAGVRLKNKIKEYLQKIGINILDLGTNTEERVDYPDYANKMVEEIIAKTVSKGILICGTGIGMSIAANRSSDIRAALCFNEFMAERARSHNDANILVLGSKICEDDISLKMIDLFLHTKFEGGRHTGRLAKIR